jgi:WD40 repeat protein
MDTASFEIVNVLPQIGGMTFSPDGKTLIFTRVGATTLIDMESLQPVKTLEETVQGDLKFDSNGRLLAIEGRWLDPIQVIDFETKQVISTIMPDNLPTTFSTFSPYGLLATGSQGGAVSVWDWETGMLLREIRVSPFDEITSLAFNPDGTLLAVGDNGGIVTLWDVSDLR